MSSGAKSTSERIATAARTRSDRARGVYVALRRASTPVRTVRRTRLARAIDPSDFTIPDDRGFVLLPPTSFGESTEIVSYAQEQAAAADLEELRKRGKDFMLPLLTPSDFERDNPIARFALRPDVLAAVSSYLGVVPILNGMNVYRSAPGTRDRYISSQLFHCDGDDTRQIKVFILCGDVGEDNGPLMILDGVRSKTLRDRVGYAYRNRVEDDEAKRVMGDDLELTAVVGPAGTTCFVDTSRCFHYGSRVDSDADARLVVIVQYVTPYSFMLPREYRSRAPYRHLADGSTAALERLVLGVE